MMPKYTEEQIQAMIDKDDVVRAEDGSVRWAANNSMDKKPGTYVSRPPNAAPLIETEIAREMQSKRWEPYQNMEAFERWAYRQQQYPMHMRTPKEGYIYFIQSEGGRIKIGQSADPFRRLSDINTHSPVELQLLVTIQVPSMNEFEKLFHEYFAAKRVKGEWFDIEPRDVYELINKFWRSFDQS